MDTAVVCHWRAEDVAVGDVAAQADRMRCQEERTATRACVVNLVVVAYGAGAAERARAAVAGLGAHHPGRILIVLPRPDGAEGINAEIELQEIDLPDRHLWWEVLTLEVGGSTAGHLPSVVEPLLLHDLPVAAWHTGRVPGPSDLVTAGSHVLLDAGEEGADASPSGPRLAEVIRLLRVRHVTDLEWVAAEPWRRALAGAFDPPARRRLLAEPDRATVTAPPWRGVLLAGWLADRLALPPERVSLRSDPAATSIELDLAGGAVRVGPDASGQVAAVLDGEPAALGGTAPGGTADLLAAALSRPATDPSYAGALAGAVRLAT